MEKGKIKELLQPIARGLFGRQGEGGLRYQRPKFELRPLDLMLSDLTAIPLDEWYRYAFSTEPLNGKFTDDQRREYSLRSIECGREYAHWVIRKYGTDQPEKLAQAMGMQVQYIDYPKNTDRVLLAEFRAPDEIYIYMDAVRRVKKQLERPEVLEILTVQLDVSGLLLAHELFHLVEERHKKEIYTHTEKIELWHVGPWVNRSNVIAFSEIAAMAFAAEIIELPYSPYVMNVFLMYDYSPQEASGVYEAMMEAAGRVPCSAPSIMSI